MSTKATDTVEVHAADESEQELLFELRREIYVEEMNLRDLESGDDLQLTDEQDPWARHLIATVDGEIAGSLRLNFGADAPFSESTVEMYQLEPFLEVMPRERIVYCNWFFVRQAYRGSMLPLELFAKATELGNEVGCELVFCGAQPHMIRMYEALGFQSYGRAVNDPEWGVWMPLILLLDVDHLSTINSPLLSFGVKDRVASEFARDAAALLPQTPAVRPGEAAGPDFAEPAGEERPALLRGLDEDELRSVLEHSYVLDLAEGDSLIRAGQITRTVYLILEGELEARDGTRVVRKMGTGELLGEVAFVLNAERSLDIVVCSESASVLGLHEPTLRTMMDTHSRAAAALIWNICQVLARRLATAG
ncbi:MAG: GNAT family N-acetyltransferase [Solirubrobacteraceae bacterium]